MLRTIDMGKEIRKAVKGITDVDTIGRSVLSPTRMDRYLRALEDETVILPEVRRQDMESNEEQIDEIGFEGRISQSGNQIDSEGKETHKDLTDDDAVKPVFNPQFITAKEIVTTVTLRDKAARRSIEKGQLENTIVDLMGNGMGRDIEENCLFADPTSNDPFLKINEGWMTLAGDSVKGFGTGKDFDGSKLDQKNTDGQYNVLAMFDSMIEKMPKPFLKESSLEKLRFYVPWNIARAYKSVLRERGTDLGDEVIVKGTLPTYDGIQVRYVPMIERGAKPQSLLSHIDNMIYGVFHEVTLEHERKPRKRATEFTMVAETGMGYERPTGAIRADITN